MRRISLLGSTGSIGTQSLDVISACGMTVAALTANRDVERMAGPADQERLCRKLLSDIKALAEQADNMVIVTGQLGEDGSLYDAGTMDYIALMGRLNQELAAWADRVTEVVFGIPVILKGEEE